MFYSFILHYLPPSRPIEGNSVSIAEIEQNMGWNMGNMLVTELSQNYVSEQCNTNYVTNKIQIVWGGELEDLGEY